jgi:hypothetical protein
MRRNFSGIAYDSIEIFHSDWMRKPVEGYSNEQQDD